MQTFLPYDNHVENAACLDNVRLHSQGLEALVCIRSLMHVYEQNPRTGAYGFSLHPVAVLWTGCELQLARYGLACADERLNNRELSKRDQASSLQSRRIEIGRWRALVNEMENNGFSDNLPKLIGDSEFHSAFRALLLYKEMQQNTYKLWKKGHYPKHLVTNSLPPRKSSWKRDEYERIWEFFGRPDTPWYSQFGWIEEPNDRLVFYGEDREPFFSIRSRRRAANPMKPFLQRKTT